jgi:glycosyltransferase involved in cell wall biosynthesis
VWLDRATSRWVTAYISNSHAGAKRLGEVERIPSKKIRVIHNGLDASPFLSASRGKVRLEFEIGHGIPVLTSVANMRPAKGHEILLDAARRLAGKGHEFSLWLVGDGDLRESIETQVQAMGLSGYVQILGFRNDIAEILADSDIFVLASHWEGLPGSIMEAMASGLPVVATHVGGIPELVLEGSTGFLVPPSDPPALASALDELLRSPKVRKFMGDSGRQRILREFSLEEKAREQGRVYAELVAGIK